MMATDSPHVPVHLIVPSGMSFRWSSPCRRACSASAFAPHFAQHPAAPSRVQKSSLERAQPVAVAAFADGLAARSAAPPDHRCLERKRRAKAEGKIKGRGTPLREKPVCTWGWRGTRQGAAACRESAQCCVGIGESTCFARWIALALDGAAL
ncbi:hypothetical protein HFK84_06585 [Ralstonia pseudosolanacearum]|uniref:hypothetical protein n=1 Tax=Ralstonia pseudosolanacearum TaxID=1310165 RepID=UPI002003E114|nr:hypothetical protein [Ralstonia pseudosolanacearum]MCK4141954.1 hypothetical protein [Ralstonia pseudosolanacearum]